MYRIIGADGKEYGPVGREQLREWAQQGRVNQHTHARLEGGTDWKPLGAFPEFGATADTPPLLGTATAVEGASRKIPAGICGILLGSFGVHKFILGYTGAGLIMLLITLLTCFIAAPLMSLIGLIEGILYLTKSDQEFVQTYVQSRKSWF